MSNEPEGKKSLNESQIETAPTDLSRRAAVKALSVAVLGTGAASLTGCFVVTRPAPAGGAVAYQTGLTDGDQGQYADPSGGGRGPRRTVATGITDSDNAATGSVQDAGGYGRGHHGSPGWQSNLTDSDGGAYADPAGNGRGTARLPYTGITDSDGGAYADQGGHGRGRR